MARRLSEDERNRRTRRTSAKEVKDFLRKRPDKYFAYYSSDEKTLTTWTGEKLGVINSKGQKYCVGGRNWHATNCLRVFRIRAEMISGDIYNGTCVADSGTYCRLQKAKRR